MEPARRPLHPPDADPQVERVAAEEQLEDTGDTMSGVAIGVVTGSQARGALLWGGIGLVVGAVLGVLLALIPIEDVSLGFRVVVAVIVGAAAGGVLGAVLGGGAHPPEHRAPHAPDERIRR